MQTIAAGTLKAKFLAIMDEVQATLEPATITKNGKPVTRQVAERAAEEQAKSGDVFEIS